MNHERWSRLATQAFAVSTAPLRTGTNTVRKVTESTLRYHFLAHRFFVIESLGLVRLFIRKCGETIISNSPPQTSLSGRFSHSNFPQKKKNTSLSQRRSLSTCLPLALAVFSFLGALTVDRVHKCYCQPPVSEPHNDGEHRGTMIKLVGSFPCHACDQREECGSFSTHFFVPFLLLRSDAGGRGG